MIKRILYLLPVITLFILLIVFYNNSKKYKLPPSFLANQALVIDQIAEEYIKNSLYIVNFDADYIERYSGSLAWLKDVKNSQRSLNEIKQRFEVMHQELSSYVPNVINKNRYVFLLFQIKSAINYVKYLINAQPNFTSEVKQFYNISLPPFDIEKYDRLLLDISKLLPGKKPLKTRFYEYFKSQKIDKKYLDRTIKYAIEICKNTSRQYFTFGDETLKFHINHFGSAKSNRKKTKQNKYYLTNNIYYSFNAFPPITAWTVMYEACSQGYPGKAFIHHLIDTKLISEQNWIEYSLIPKYSLMNFVYLGLLSNTQKLFFSKNVKGIDFIENILQKSNKNKNDARLLFEISQKYEEIQKIQLYIASEYLDRRMPKTQAIQMLEKYLLLDKNQAEERLLYFVANRTLLLSEGLAGDMINNYLVKKIRVGIEPWAAYDYLIQNPYFILE